jgi:pyoverdine/dityrosine biosynthesis protein Dit1
MNYFYSHDPADDAQRYLNSETFEEFEESRKCKYCGITIEKGCDCDHEEQCKKDLEENQ